MSIIKTKKYDESTIIGILYQEEYGVYLHKVWDTKQIGEAIELKIRAMLYKYPKPNCRFFVLLTVPADLNKNPLYEIEYKPHKSPLDTTIDIPRKVKFKSEGWFNGEKIDYKKLHMDLKNFFEIIPNKIN